MKKLVFALLISLSSFSSFSEEHVIKMLNAGKEGKQIADAITSANPMGGDNVPQPGEGPSKESREQGNYDVIFFADIDGETVEARVTGDMDPGYGSTSKMITESAICLVQDCPNLKGGIYTPAPAMGEKLIKRLTDKAGLTFDIV